jgi:GYF domain 2
MNINWEFVGNLIEWIVAAVLAWAVAFITVELAFLAPTADKGSESLVFLALFIGFTFVFRRMLRRLQGVRVMTNGWHYAEGEKTVGPLDLKEMQIVLSKVSDPRNLQVWRAGFKEWERAGNVQELAEFIHEPPPLLKPPPLPKTTRLRRKPWAKVVYGLGILMFFMGFVDNTVLRLGALAAIFTLDDLRT